MRFRRLRLKVFGPHRDRDLELESDLVLVFGSNESGKSSFRSAIETIVYGFDPAKRDAHPLYQWSPGEDLHLEADLEVDAGSVLRVERVLQANGKSRTASGGEAFSGRRQGNRPLAQLAYLPREIFRAVYSLELSQLESLQRGVQEHVDDLLLPETDDLALRSVSEIRAGLHRDHLDLWRRDRRGRPRARELHDELSAARARSQEAAQEEQQLRDLRVERSALEGRLQEHRARKRALERSRDEAPYLQELFEYHRLCDRLAQGVDLSPLGELPLVDPATLSGELEELQRDLLEPSARLEHQPEQLGDTERAQLDASAEIETILHAEPMRDQNRARIAELLARAESARDEARRTLAAVMTREARSDDSALLRELPLESLRLAQAEWAAAWERRAAAPPPPPPRAPAWSVALGASGLVLLVLAVLGSVPPFVSVPGGLLMIAAFIGSQRSRAPHSEPPPPRPQEVDRALSSLPVSPQFTATPIAVQKLIEELARARLAMADASRNEGEASGLVEEAARQEAEGLALCRALALDESGSVAQRTERLRSALDQARERAERVETDQLERRQAQLLIDSHRPAVERKRVHLERVEQALLYAEPGATSSSQAFARVQERRNEERFAQRRRIELEADARWGRLHDDARVTLDEEPSNADWNAEVAARREDEIAALDLEIQGASTRMGELQSRLDRGHQSERARASETVASLEEELRNVKRERDRLALLESLLEQAERDYRDAHQPDVLRRASAYLERVTQGRYTRLDYRPAAEGGLHVTCSDREEPIPVRDPISRGTLDQIFLCLRLGLLDHLDEDREHLPLLLDDALLRMDDGRRPDVYALLQEISPRRQVFLLTCQRWIADEAERALKVRRIDLTG